MARPVARCARIACSVAVFASLVACGGASDPGLFSASSNAGVSNRAGASAEGGASAHGGSAAQGGASNSGGDSAGGGAANGGAANGGAANGGAANGGNSAAGASGAAQAGASNHAGASAGGNANGGAATGGSAGSVSNAGSGGDAQTCQTLFAKASKQLAAAQVCSLAADAMQCTGTVKNLCKCEVPVNRTMSAETMAYDATVEQLDKKKCVQLCLALACLPANHAVCQASAPGSAAGTCVSSYAQAL